MKKAIRYLRFSSDGQSHSSIEKQDLYTTQWLERNKVVLVDTFIDAGHSAKTFDRPDFKKLQDFINKYHSSVDYLVVDELDRFSRDAGEALIVVKKLQMKYNVQIVSVSENITFDYNTPGSFFRTGLSLLLAEENNINRSNKINGGIYTAKAKEGRYIYNKPPFGYEKVGTGKDRHLIINDYQAVIVKFVFESFLRNTPQYIIYQEACKMGLSVKGNSVIQKILENPVYIGKQQVKAFKELPGGLYTAKHEPIIDPLTWESVQLKLRKPVKSGPNQLTEDLPLRGVLKCHCGRVLTGAASRGRHGGLFFYYKCNHGRHNNISARKAHDQMNRIMELMSLPKSMVIEIKEESERQFEERCRNNKLIIEEKKTALANEDAKIKSIEEKWILNQMQFETYDRWMKDISTNRINLRMQIEQLSQDQNALYKKLYNVLETLTDLKYVFNKCSISDKQELLRKGFDSNLYYKEGIYRTPTMLEPLAHNSLKMKEEGVLIYEKKGDSFSRIPSSGVEGSRTPVQTSLPLAFYMLISLLFVGIEQEMNKPTQRVAE